MSNRFEPLPGTRKVSWAASGCRGRTEPRSRQELQGGCRKEELGYNTVGREILVHARGRIDYEERQRMADECSRFLTWALRHPESVPRIPRRREDSGSFSPKLKRAFWGHALEEVEKGLARSALLETF